MKEEASEMFPSCRACAGTPASVRLWKAPHVSNSTPKEEGKSMVRPGQTTMRTCPVDGRQLERFDHIQLSLGRSTQMTTKAGHHHTSLAVLPQLDLALDIARVRAAQVAPKTSVFVVGTLPRDEGRPRNRLLNSGAYVQDMEHPSRRYCHEVRSWMA